MVGTVAGATTAGQVMRRVKHYKIAPIVGLSISMIAVATLGYMAGNISLIGLELLFACISAGGEPFCPSPQFRCRTPSPSTKWALLLEALIFSGALGSGRGQDFGGILLGGGVAAGLHGQVGTVTVPTDVVVAAFRMMFFSAAGLRQSRWS